jgi:copper resistance protein B
LKTEGERLFGQTADAKVEALWGHAFATFWDWQAGVRRDFGGGPTRTWAAFGVQGLAPYWFDVEATLYVSNGGRLAARVRATYDVRLSQRSALTPEIEANVYSKTDQAREIGRGLADVRLGLRLRYELRRDFAPYIGVVWSRKLGRSAEFARAAGQDAVNKQIVAGIRWWF